MSGRSDSYRALALALESRTPLACRYGGHARVICPIILGHRDAAEMALVFQIAGQTSAGPLREPQWKCLRVAGITDLAIADLEWQSGYPYRHPQHCVTAIDHAHDPADRARG